MKKRKNSFFRSLAIALSLISLVVLIGIGGICIYSSSNIDYSVDESLFMASKSGNITKFYYDGSYGKGDYLPTELCILEPYGNKKEWYSYGDIGDNIKNAFLSAEDRRFFDHNGVDIKRTAYALVNYFLHVKPKFGASTITQQVIKNISGDDEQTLTRKLSEILRAIHIENAHTKEEIFEVYLNIVPMGEGISGVGYAAEYYFGKEPHELSLAEAATLTGITNAPTRYNPHTNPKACLEKRNTVLYAMLDAGVISDEEYRTATECELSVLEPRGKGENINSWFVETACDDICRDLAESMHISENTARVLLYNGGFSVYTTVNPKIQDILEKYFENEENFPTALANGLNYSMVITDSHSGNLVAIVGGAGEKRGNRLLNYATVPHTPASTLKPLALYAPLINSKTVNWATVLDDTPVSFTKSASGEYTEYPKNSPQVYDGLTTLADALRLSKNTVAVRLYNILGKDKIFDNLCNDFEFDTLVDGVVNSDGKKITDRATSPLALGQLTYGVSLRRLTEAYTVFPSEGVLSAGRSYIAVYDGSGELLLDNTRSTKRVFTTDCARIMNQLLMQVTESGTARSITLGDIVDTAGKTGTSGGDKDRLFVGYTPYYTAGIWCGYGDERSIGTQRVSHLSIWNDVMKEVHEYELGTKDSISSFSTDGLLYLPYCKDSGELYSEPCLYDPRGERLAYGYFTEDNKPTALCKRHIFCIYDSLTGAVATEGCPKENLILISLLDISERSFPKEVYITDAEYVYREVGNGIRLGESYDMPFFIYTLDEGEFVGISKNKKQFNSSCYLHND